MRHALSCAAVAAMIWLGLASAQTTKNAAPKQAKKTTASTVPHKASPAPAARKGAAQTAPHTASATSKKAPARKGTAPARRQAVTWRNRQMAPSADRYREIQNALITRGYLSPEQATGTWDSTSMDAMKRFQSEQNIDSTGKINSLSLIALGLGPKRDEKVVLPTPPQLEPNGQDLGR